MRWSASLVAVVILLLAIPALAGQDQECAFDPAEGKIVCHSSGTIDTDDPPTKEPAKNPTERPPIRYLYSTGECYYWSRIPGGIDAWDPANENTVYGIVLGTPECDPTVTDPLPDRAWRVFRSFPLAVPAPSFQPANHGITGHPTYLAAANPAAITHSEMLPDGRTFEVRAQVASLTVDWGDERTSTEDPDLALPYPAGAVTHTYTTKTCPPDYRVTHPSGPNCHPTLDAYPVAATFTWSGEYRVGGSWIPIGTLDLTTTIFYDVDEVIGVLVDP